MSWRQVGSCRRWYELKGASTAYGSRLNRLSGPELLVSVQIQIKAKERTKIVDISMNDACNRLSAIRRGRAADDLLVGQRVARHQSFVLLVPLTHGVEALCDFITAQTFIQGLTSH